MEAFQNTDSQKAKLEAVRDLIFGQDLRHYEEELEKINERIDENRSVINEEMQSTKEDLMKAIQRLEENVMQRIDSVRDAAMRELKRQDEAHLSKDSLSKVFSYVSQNLV